MTFTNIDKMSDLDCAKIIATIESVELSYYNLFITAMSKRVGSSNEITMDEIIDGFSSKLITVDRNDILKYWYNAVIRGLSTRLIYTGAAFFIAESDDEIHAFINQVWDSAEKCKNKDFGEILKKQAHALNQHIYGENKDKG